MPVALVEDKPELEHNSSAEDILTECIFAEEDIGFAACHTY